MILGVSSSGLSQLYRQQTTDYTKQLEQIASGKRFTKPSDDFAGYAKLRAAEGSLAGYQRVNDDLVKGKEFSSAASAVGNEAYKGLLELKQMAEDYTNASTDEKAQLSTAFDKKLGSLTELFSSNAKIDGTSMNAYIVNVNPSDPGPTGSNLTLNLTDPTGEDEWDDIDITDVATINDALKTVATYTAEADAFTAQTDRQLTINQNIIAAKENTVAAIGSIDEVSAIGKATALQVRQQATIAMASQANLSQLNLARLFS
jgi:flagellin-like hook-associated protein FlgL